MQLVRLPAEAIAEIPEGAAAVGLHIEIEATAIVVATSCPLFLLEFLVSPLLNCTCHLLQPLLQIFVVNAGQLNTTIHSAKGR